MIASQIKNYLYEKGITFRITNNNGKEEILMNCPQCEDTEFKLGIDSQTGCWQCFHANRIHPYGKSGSWLDFQKIFGDEPKRLVTEKDIFKSKPKYTIPKQEIIPAEGDVFKYLKSRGLTEGTIRFFQIGQTEEKNAIIFPYFKNKVIVNKKILMLDRPNDKKSFKAPKGAEPSLFNMDNVVGDTVICCEGELDTMTLWQYGLKHVVSVHNGANDQQSIANEWEWLSNFKTIIIAYDNDIAGNEGAEKLANRLGRHRCYRAIPPHDKKDWNDCLMDNIDALDIASSIANMIDFSPPELITPYNIKDRLVERFLYPEKFVGIPTLFTNLTKVIGGWRMGEVSVWSGYNSSGKTTMLNQVVLDLCAKDNELCIASLELPPERYMYWMLCNHLGTRHPSQEAIENAVNYLSKYIHLVNCAEMMSKDHLFDLFEYAVKRYGTNTIIIDSLMRITMNDVDKNAEQKAFVNKCTSFAKQHNVHIHLVAHLRKPYSAGGKLSTEKFDVAGSGDITNLADNVFIIDRKYFDGDIKTKPPYFIDAELRVVKNREEGIEKKIPLTFDNNTKKYTEYRETGNSKDSYNVLDKKY
jgi:twinkle protein